MNLLTDPWIPTETDGKLRLANYQEILCTDKDFRITLPRDDMELAALQLLISLTQVVFLPEDAKQLIARIREPLTAHEFEERIARYIDWFDLDHPTQPFMQTRGIKSKDSTPIQKLFAGLPEGNNHAFFNDAGEIRVIGAAAAAIALFNQASNCPSFGGGFKGSLRGGAPVTTLVSDPSLRKTLWLNVLHRGTLSDVMPWFEATEPSDTPTWVQPIKEKDKISVNEIGLARGLFWQPTHVELLKKEQTGSCDLLNIDAGIYDEFNKEKFVFEVVGNWPHPHSARTIDVKKGQKEERYASFTTTAPAWTQLNTYMIQRMDDKSGVIPAPVISQYRQIARGKTLELKVGGYRNKQASILQRRHEFFSIAPGWDSNSKEFQKFIETALAIKSLLRNKLYGFVKTTGIHGLQEKAEAQFYHLSEPVIHQYLRKIDWNELGPSLHEFVLKLKTICHDIFQLLTQPYQHDPRMIHALATSRRGIEFGFYQMLQGIKL